MYSSEHWKSHFCKVPETAMFNWSTCTLTVATRQSIKQNSFTIVIVEEFKHEEKNTFKKKRIVHRSGNLEGVQFRKNQK